MADEYILAIDQGTTSTRLLLFDRDGRAVASAAQELKQHYPQPGWVEHDVEEIWQSFPPLAERLFASTSVRPDQIAAIGVTNQRETTVIWHRSTGQPIARAIVWQDRRTSDFCRQHAAKDPWLYERTGLVLDPYFCATKIRWLLDHVAGARTAAEKGELAFGTIDSYLLWRLTNGQVHATDVSNASRSLLLNLHAVAWDDELTAFFDIPKSLLPEVLPSSHRYGVTAGLNFLPDGIPITGVAGDQQAALFGQRCFSPGEAKCTYGTGAFFLMHTGSEPKLGRHRLVATLAATTGPTAEYALEGSIFIAGAAVQWLRDGLHLIARSADVEPLARQASMDEEVIFVPALVGLGAPHWVPEARGTIFGLTRATTAADLARAALESVALQVVDLEHACRQDAGLELADLRVDGGMVANEFFVQMQADLLGRTVVRSGTAEATALGAAFLAGLQVGFWPDRNALRALPGDRKSYAPAMDEAARHRRISAWRRAVQTTVQHYRSDATSP